MQKEIMSTHPNAAIGLGVQIEDNEDVLATVLERLGYGKDKEFGTVGNREYPAIEVFLETELGLVYERAYSFDYPRTILVVKGTVTDAYEGDACVLPDDVLRYAFNAGVKNKFQSGLDNLNRIVKEWNAMHLEHPDDVHKLNEPAWMFWGYEA